MAQGDLTDAQKEYAKKCLEAAAKWPKPNLSVEQMRQQVERNHAEVMRREELLASAKEEGVKSKEEQNAK